jgi:hypothetical protein
MVMFWVSVLAISMLLYLLLDGFDLGVGMLFGLTRSEASRTIMLRTIAPFWDGNETWLIVTAVCGARFRSSTRRYLRRHRQRFDTGLDLAPFLERSEIYGVGARRHDGDSACSGMATLNRKAFVLEQRFCSFDPVAELRGRLWPRPRLSDAFRRHLIELEL